MTEERLTSQMVEDAIDVLEERGWCKGSFVDDDGRVCVLGAIQVGRNRFVNREGFLNPTKEPFMDVKDPINIELGERLGAPNMNGGDIPWVAKWNDYCVDTVDRVIDALTGVAKDLRNEGR